MVILKEERELANSTFQYKKNTQDKEGHYIVVILYNDNSDISLERHKDLS